MESKRGIWEDEGDRQLPVMNRITFPAGAPLQNPMSPAELMMESKKEFISAFYIEYFPFCQVL